MRTRPTSEHQEAVTRRLALLGAELASVRPQGVEDPQQPDDWMAPHTRLPTARAAPVGAGPGTVEDDPAPLVPAPGRHASRRSRRLVPVVVPETLRGRVVLGPSQVTVLAVLVALGLAVTCWWLVRGRADEVVAPSLPSPAAGLVSVSPDASTAVPGVASGTASTSTGDAGTAGSVTVDVAGKVRRPGIAVLDAGARVVDALEAAGGARPGVDLTELNLARLLVDGEQIVVGVAVPSVAVGTSGPSPTVPGSPTGALVDLNTATQSELEALPEVGPVTAQAIVAWRDEHGGFTAVDELLEVDGIGDATLSQLAPYVTV
ncbi:helix-hairpin-helix domain-containing protein [Nocardioides sp. MAHUQ-72]|uniref:helix-hairpin-helix domain-containing protein n=1 Tax=unclassified Nocardioides TaxID=2615069 RepID=UPI0036186FC5